MAVRLVDEAFGFLPEGAVEQVRADLQVGYAALAVVLAAPYAGSLPALRLIAAADRSGRRPLVLAGAAVMALALAGFAAATSTAQAVAAALAWGFGGTLLVHGVEVELAVGARGRPEGELHRQLRSVNLWGTVGDVLGPLLLAAVLLAGWSWRVAFAVAAGLTALYGCWLGQHRFLPVPAPGGPAAGAPAWRDRLAWCLGLYGCLLVPFDEAWLAFLIAWLQVEGGWSAATAALAGIVAVAGAALGFGPVAARTARHDERAVLRAAALVLALAGSVVPLVPPLLAVLAGLAVNAAAAAAWVTLQHAALTLRPGGEGRVLSLVAAIEHGAVVLPLALGIVADRAGLAATFPAHAALAVGLVVAGGGWRSGVSGAHGGRAGRHAP